MILSKDVLVSNISTELSDNSTGQISPYDIRHNLLDLIDSVHLLTIGKPLSGSNFGTDNIRTTRVGEESLSKINLAGYYSIDNTAVGYSSLRSNYQGVKNTAVGSHSLFCNIYGEHNSALGYSSLGGNTVGIGNVGVGSYTLNNNKGGNFNIAIGHGAGYYLSNDTSNKLFIASHPIDSGYICANPFGSGLTPLVYGDLSSLILGIKVTSLHSDGVLQVGGHTSPSTTNSFSLGTSSYSWRNLYLSSGIYFDTNLYISKKTSSNLEIKGDLLPQTDKTYSLGSMDYLWQSGYFNNIYVSGLATINRYVALENCSFYCKTLTLAASGSFSVDGGGPDTLYDYSDQESPQVSNCGYLTDQDLTGAGFTIQATGTGYSRQYSLLFSQPDQTLTCLQQDTPYSRASWNSNISLHIASGSHLRTDRIIFPSSINIVNSSGCFGIFSRGSGLFFSKSELVSHNQRPSGYLAGVGNVNFYATSGDFSDYIINFSTPESGTIIKHRFLTGIKKKAQDNLNNNLDKLNGFEFQYIDDANSVTFGPTGDRLIIGSYNNTSEIVNAITLMKTTDTEGAVCINNLTPSSKNILPATTLNIRSANNAIARLTAENQATTKSAIQLLGESNCLVDGFEASYLNGSGIADLSMFIDSGKEVYVRFYDEDILNYPSSTDFYSIGILNSEPSGLDSNNNRHGMISIGSSGNNHASISMREYEYGTVYSSDPVYRPQAKAKRSIYFISAKVRPNQSHSMYMIDGSGNLHDLINNPYDITDGRVLYTDSSGNLFGGLYCPDNRNDLNDTYRNTAIGYKAIYSITTGDDNSIFGANSGSGIATGNKNTIIGSNSVNTLTSGNNNIVIGSNAFNNTLPGISHSIIIGNNGIANGTSGDYRFVVGNSGVVLLDGILGPSNNEKYLSIPSGGKFLVNDSTNTDSLQLRANYIEVIDRGGSDYPNNTLAFTFAGNESAELLSLNHSADPMTNNPVYQSPLPLRPYAQLNGDLKLRGAIRFSDNTSLSSASFLNNISVLESGVTTINNNINNIFGSFVEGYVYQQINAPTDGATPTTGVLYLKNQSWSDTGNVTLINRDTTSIIHSGAYVIAIKINNEFRPLWISASNTSCQCCR